MPSQTRRRRRLRRAWPESAGTRFSTIRITNTGGSSNTGLRWKISPSFSSIAATPAALVATSLWPVSPRIENSTSAIRKLGPVEYIMCRMCSNSSDPATAGARLVVSDSGDILSPKYAPEMIAPAAMPRLIPSPLATPDKRDADRARSRPGAPGRQRDKCADQATRRQEDLRREQFEAIDDHQRHHASGDPQPDENADHHQDQDRW